MTDTLILQRILHDIIIDPEPTGKTSPFIYILIIAVVLITAVLIRYMLKKKAAG